MAQHPVPTLVLGLVHRGVCLAQQGLQIAAVLRHDSDADAGTPSQFRARDLRRGLHAPADPVADLQCVGGVVHGCQHHELIAGEPDNDIEAAQAGGQVGGDIVEEAVPGRMAERVIHALEVVYVQGDQRQ